MALGDLVQQLLDRLLGPLFDKIKSALGPLGRLFDKLKSFFEKSVNVFGKFNELGGGIYEEVIAWKQFRENIAFRTRVINLPSAITKTQEFVDQLIAAWRAVVDLASKLRDSFRGGEEDPTAEAEDTVKDLESSGIIKTFLEKFPKIAKGLEKVLAALTIVITVLDDMIDLADDLQAILEACRAIREEVETADAIFLKNTNPRRTVRLEDGTTMKIRVGNLHT